MSFKSNIPVNCKAEETIKNRIFCPHCNESKQDTSTIKHATGNHNFRCSNCNFIFGVHVEKVTLFTPYKIPEFQKTNQPTKKDI